MSTYDSQNAILELVGKATQKLFEVDITPRLKSVLPLLSSITLLARRYDELTNEERDDAFYFCHKVNAYLNLDQDYDLIFDHTTMSKEEFRRNLREFAEICEISIDWIAANEVQFNLPPRIDHDLVESIGRILWSCKSKNITVNSLPLELAPFIPQLDNLCVKADSDLAFETSVGVLHRAGVRSKQYIKFTNVNLRNPVSSLAIDCISSFYQAQDGKVLLASPLAC